MNIVTLIKVTGGRYMYRGRYDEEIYFSSEELGYVEYQCTKALYNKYPNLRFQKFRVLDHGSRYFTPDLEDLTLCRVSDKELHEANIKAQRPQ